LKGLLMVYMEAAAYLLLPMVRMHGLIAG
jgi:hypothetical protein